jgi:hypothetical protein
LASSARPSRGAYRSGSDAAIADLPKKWFPKSGIGQQAREAVEIPNARVIENLAQALSRDVGRLDMNIPRAARGRLPRCPVGAAARIASGAFTRRQASQTAWQRTLDKILACSATGPTGRVLVENAVKDNQIRAVQVHDTLPDAMAKGLFHPNCRHSISAYLPGITKPKTNTADPEGHKARQKQRYLECKIRTAREEALGALTPEAERVANAEVRAAQAALRAHLAAHPNLKRLPYWEQVGAGSILKGQPKGGPVQDLAPPVQQVLV